MRLERMVRFEPLPSCSAVLSALAALTTNSLDEQVVSLVVIWLKSWHSDVPTAKFEFSEPVEHGGFEPPTPCLPGKGGGVLGIFTGSF